MIDESKIRSMVDDVFSESFEIDREKLKAEASIFEGLGLDSLDIVDLIVALQKKFDIKIRDDERVRQIRTLGDIYSFVLLLKEEGCIPDAGA